MTGIPDFFTGIDENEIISSLYKNGLKGNMSPKHLVERKIIDYGTPNHQTGGIDPTTGFTRRCMNYYIGVDYSSPLSKKVILDKFAGTIGNINNISNTSNTPNTPNIYIHFIILFIIILFFIFTLYYKFKLNYYK